MILGLTGFSGAGKSTVAAIFKEQGFYHLDCDDIVHHQVYRDPQVLQALADSFGTDILCQGALDRAALRNHTMGNPQALDRLNQTVMPFILDAIQQTLDAHKKENIILDAPLLFESGLDLKCNKVLSVISDPKKAANRIIERDHLRPEEAKKRLSSQHPADFYIQKSDYFIINDGDLSSLREKTLKLIRMLGEKE
jgi:dephospho-CoA kinase